MILPAQPLVIIERFRQEHFVTRTTELIRSMHFRLQECALVKRRLCFDELARCPRKQRRIVERQRVVRALLDGVITVAARAINRNNAVTHRAGDAGAAEWIVGDVVVGIVPLRKFKRARKKRHRIVATRAKPCVVNRAFALERLLARLANARRIERIVERT